MAARVIGGFNQYGFTVGILMLDTRFPRIVGDMGNAATFDFPVRYHRVSGADPDLVVRRGASGLLPSFVEGARALEREGVSAITTNCGFLVKFQRELCAAVTVPVFTSSLLLVPLVHRMLAPRRRVGILTVNAGTLTPEHLEGAGVGPDIPIAVAGLETEKEFTRVLLGDELELDVDAARDERSEEHTSELQSRLHLVCRLLLEKKKQKEENHVRQIHPRGRARLLRPAQGPDSVCSAAAVQ